MASSGGSKGKAVIRPAASVLWKDDVIFIPPGVEHAIYNTGMIDLRFIVVTSPPDE